MKSGRFYFHIFVRSANVPRMSHNTYKDSSCSAYRIVPANIDLRGDFRQIMVGAFSENSNDTESWEQRYDEAVASGRHLLLTFNDMAVGAASLDIYDNCWAQFRNIAIDPAFQGKGHGRILLRCIENLSSHFGAQEIQLLAAPDVIDFYKHMGYEENAAFSEPPYTLFTKYVP